MTARVLIAEDETLIRLDLRGLLEAAGFDVCARRVTVRRPSSSPGRPSLTSRSST